jgi:hypothetical protein
MTRTWGGLVLESRVEYGSAARKGRGRYAGQKVHRLGCEYVVGVIEGHIPGEIGRAFLRTGEPQLFSCHPACGCTQGQHAGKPYAKLTAADVTCEKCL